jgi:hypothetical protein
VAPGKTAVDRGASGSSQLQLRPLSAAQIPGFRLSFMLGLHGRPKKGGIRLLRNWYLTT